ncbi:MAG: WbqC family protein [Solirubrobacteraceae bacterium]
MSAMVERPGRRVAIVQSNYIPWKGYFDLINAVDQFVLLDDVQYTRRDWRNRNRIKTPAGTRWITIPVRTHGRYEQRINETRIADPRWQRSHWSAIEQAYRSAPHFAEVAPSVEALYREVDAELLSQINYAYLRRLCHMLGISTPISWSTDYPASGRLSQRLLDICIATGATEYLSGPLARGYLDVQLFERAGVQVSWFDYSGYPAYPQLHGVFDHAVSVLDLLFCAGEQSPRYLKTTTAGAARLEGARR